MPDPAYLQYGALGLLALSLIGGYKLGKYFVEVFVLRTVSTFEKQAASMERIAETFVRIEAANETRHREVLSELKHLNGAVIGGDDRDDDRYGH